MDIDNRVDIGDGVDIGNGEDNDIPWADRLPYTNPNRTKSGICSNNYDMCDVMDEEISFMEEI